MRKLWSLAVLVALVLVPAVASAVTLDEIVYLSKAGVAESVILALIDRDKPVFALAPDQLVTLKQEGVSDAVVLAMLKSGRAEGDAAAKADEAFNTSLYLSDRAAAQAEEAAARAAPQPQVVPVPVPVVVPVAVPYAAGGRHRGARAPRSTFAPAVPPPSPIVPSVAPMSSAVPTGTASSLCVAHVATGPAPALLNAPGFLTACPAR